MDPNDPTPQRRRRGAAAAGTLLLPSVPTLLLGVSTGNWLPAVIGTGAPLLVLVLGAVLVVWPAVWAKDKKRRAAAKAVLDLLLARPGA